MNTEQSQKNQTATLAAFQRATYVQIGQGSPLRINDVDEDEMVATAYDENVNMPQFQQIDLTTVDPRTLSFMELKSFKIQDSELD